jgi:hypothetical protein
MEDHNSQELATTDQSGNQRSQILYGLYHLFTGIFKVIWLILSGIFNLIWGLCRKYSTQIKDLTNRYQEWIITMFQEHLGSWVKMNGALISIFFVFILSWFAVIGPFIIAPFTMSESADIDSIKAAAKHNDNAAVSTKSRRCKRALLGEHDPAYEDTAMVPREFSELRRPEVGMGNGLTKWSLHAFNI